MSESEIQRIWQSIHDVAQKLERLAEKIEGQSVLLGEVRKDVKGMSVNGCAKASEHNDHEDRLRVLETSQNKAVGAAAIIGAICGIVGGWLMTKIGG